MSEKQKRDKISISFSGGRSSALMTKMVLDKYKSSQIEITFANTGFEHEDTLRFVDECDKNLFGGRVVWLESVTNPEHGVGVDFKVVNYETAARNGEPYVSGARKYGLWNQTSPSCTDRLKIEPMEKYLKTKGFLRGKKINYWTAIGIRADEIDRQSSKRKEMQLFYPLIEAGITKRDVMLECAKLPFDLKIPEHYGNCVGCFKKSLRKLGTIARDNPEAFDRWAELEEELKEYKNKNNHDKETGFRRIYRKQMTVSDLIQIGNSEDFKPFVEDEGLRQKEMFSAIDEMDIEFGCGQACEIYSEE